MKILADQYLYRLNDFIPEGVMLHRYNPSDGLPDGVTDYDALLIRTVTAINPETLPNRGKLKFIGTATAGFDHVDRAYLNERGIQFASSEGCNANAVGLYVATVLLKWSVDRNINLRDLKVGIVGCGHTGGRARAHLEGLGVAVAGYDPPKEEREEGFMSVSEEELLDCEILTFHTPLTSGEKEEYPTKHICSHDWLSRGFRVIINAARGGVVDEQALREAKQAGLIGDYILDVWEDEPLFSDLSAENATIATPHIAGYSIESKLRASELVVNQMLEYFQIEANGKSMRDKRSNEESRNEEEDSAKRLELLSQKFDIPEVANRLWTLSNIEYYDRELRKLCGESDPVKAKSFAALRSETKLRTERIRDFEF